MSEIKTLNGYSLADTKAREDIASLTKENVNIWAEIDALKSDDNVETTKKVKSGQFVSFTPVLKTSTSVKNKMIMNTAFEWSNVNAIRLVSGQNVMDFTPFVGAPGTVYEKNGLRAVVNDDGTMTVSGTNTSTGWTNVFEKMVSYKNQQYQAFPAGTYTIPDGMIMQIIGLNGAWDSISGNKQGTFTVDRAFYVYNVMVAFAGSLTVNKTIPLCMVRGNAIPSSGYVYEGTVYSVTFSSKVADGVFDWQTGVLKDSDGNEIE